MGAPQIDILYSSGFFQIRNYKCHCVECDTSAVEYSNSFFICFVRSGYFEYQTFRRALEMHVGRVMFSKPGIEHRVRHIDNQPDICSVFDFSPEFYRSLQEHYNSQAGWFFKNRDLHSIMVRCAPEIDYLHGLILRQTLQPRTDRVLLDDWVLRLVDKLMNLALGNDPPLEPLSASLKKYHLQTVAQAKEYFLKHFSEDIGLHDVAAHCCLSLFHFSRIFKAIMKVSPHQYLNEIRLHHAQMLIEDSNLPVTQIALRSGFNSLEYFDTAYKQRFSSKPSDTRKQLR
jgi:AraC family transcriptional regulator